MRVLRASNFAGLSGLFPKSLQPAVNDLVRRLELELNSIYYNLQNTERVSRDSEVALATTSGERLYVKKSDGSMELIEVTFDLDR